jgi:hypothetical protein
MKFRILILILIFTVSAIGTEASDKETFPKLANLYLNPIIPEGHYDGLSRFDLLIIDIDVPTTAPNLLTYFKNKNSSMQILSYVPSQSVNVQDLGYWADFRRETYDKVSSNDWWLNNDRGEAVIFDGWPTIKFVDGGSEWGEYLSTLTVDIISEDKWDGIFYDMVFADLSWLDEGNIDIDRDGRRDTAARIDSYWNNHMEELIDKTKEKLGDKKLVASVNRAENFEENLNGVMYENFPAPWFGDNAWPMLIDQYVNKLSERHIAPQLSVINSNTGNTGDSASYQDMRFGLTSTLLGDGYFCFDSGDQNHGQNWWYDEYDVNLGKSVSSAYNLLEKNNDEIKKGLWRRDFENGTVVVNSTNKTQVYIFEKEQFEKIKGAQDSVVNSGEKINWIRIPASDGIVLLKINADILDNSFSNGSFVRVFNHGGAQVRNGFFSYKDEFPGSVQVLVSDIDNDTDNEILVNGEGRISVYDNGKMIASFLPYDGVFRGEISFFASDLNNDGIKEIVTGAGAGGGPHVRVFTKDGRPLIGGFFAYDKNFRGGVNITVMDLNNDGIKEIITGAGAGGGPHVRVFTKDGRPLIGGFFAYDKNFRGGVSVATGDIDANGVKEIITAPASSMISLVKIFTKDGIWKNEFVAYEGAPATGATVMSDDINKDGVDEILVSLN